ncbi:MAG: sigma-70 family RNA polymerase sigma factor [Deltaproteobacteria bacterium]|nr:sigma-70 family RNA polymerase sigma factor [Deltaproteobacteria bacterium]
MKATKHLSSSSPYVSPSLPADEELVSRAINGDGWAEEAIFRKHVHFVTSLAAKLLRRQAEVEDVVQDTFLLAYRDLNKLNNTHLLRHWLARITVRSAQSQYRRRRIKQVLGLDTGIDDERLCDQLRTDAPQEILVELSLLDSVFDSLSVSERICWVLRKLEGYQLNEICAISGCSLATAKRRINSANQKIREYIATKEADECI